MALRIEPTTGAAVAAILLLGQPWDVAVGEGAVWLLGGGPQRSVIPVGDWDVGSGTVWRIDPGTNEVVATVELPGGVDGDARIATGAGGVWVTGGSVNTIFRIDPATNRISETIPVQSDAGAVAVGRGSLWVVSEGYGTVKRIDPATHEVIATIDIRGGCVCSVAVGAGGVWATS